MDNVPLMQTGLSIYDMLQDAGKSTGVVTTTRITHASPAGAYAQTANRDWENDAQVQNSGQDPNKCDDIAKQLITSLPGRNIKVRIDTSTVGIAQSI
jgi:alkaline phosphatase